MQRTHLLEHVLESEVHDEEAAHEEEGLRSSLARKRASKRERERGRSTSTANSADGTIWKKKPCTVTFTKSAASSLRTRTCTQTQTQEQEMGTSTSTRHDITTCTIIVRERYEGRSQHRPVGKQFRD
jgi:hypothetical protein